MNIPPCNDDSYDIHAGYYLRLRFKNRNVFRDILQNSEYVLENNKGRRQRTLELRINHHYRSSCL